MRNVFDKSKYVYARGRGSSIDACEGENNDLFSVLARGRSPDISVSETFKDREDGEGR